MHSSARAKSTEATAGEEKGEEEEDPILDPHPHVSVVALGGRGGVCCRCVVLWWGGASSVCLGMVVAILAQAVVLWMWPSMWDPSRRCLLWRSALVPCGREGGCMCVQLVRFIAMVHYMCSSCRRPFLSPGHFLLQGASTCPQKGASYRKACKPVR